MTSPGLQALRDGTAVVPLRGWRVMSVEGTEALPWLDDLLTADLAPLRPGAARRTLLLTPTGRIRADLVAARADDGVLLLQDPEQPTGIDTLLDPYVLSSNVRLTDRSSERVAIVVMRTDVQVPDGATALSPSVLGSGVIVVVDEPLAGTVLDELGRGMTEARAEDVERWRIERGIARFPVDLLPESLPHEADLGDAIADAKGCFLGQEAVARVRNLGHPPFLVQSGIVQGAAAPGNRLTTADGGDAGTITSAAPRPDGGTAVIARIRWSARDDELRTGDGDPVEGRSAAR